MVVWLCHARVGHRQGPYTEQPSPETVRVFLFNVAAARKARRLQQVTARGLTPQNPRSNDRGFCFYAIGNNHPSHPPPSAAPIMGAPLPRVALKESPCSYTSKHGEGLVGIGLSRLSIKPIDPAKRKWFARGEIEGAQRLPLPQVRDQPWLFYCKYSEDWR